MDALSQYVPQLLALAGTLGVAALGFYQWRKQSSNESRRAAAEARRKAAELLWSKLEEVNLSVREASALESGRFKELEREVNSLYLRNSLYLDDRVQALVREYAKALFRVSSLLTGQAGPAADEWANTAIQVPAIDSPEVQEALDIVSRLRAEMKDAMLEATGA